MEIRRGDIFLVALDPVIGSEQGKTRPCLVVQNNYGNKFSPITIIVPLTKTRFEKEYLTNVEVNAKESGLTFDSTILLNQIRAIDKSRLLKRLTSLNQSIMNRVDTAIKASLGLY